MAMKLFQMTKKQFIIRALLLAALVIGAAAYLYTRAFPVWHDVLRVPPEARSADAPMVLLTGGTQESAIPPPEGYERIPAAEESFLYFTRNLPIWPLGSSIMTYDGKPLSSANAAAVYTLSLPDSGYQQCADTIIRLWSAYFESTGQYDRIAFQFSNGYETNYMDWQEGWRYIVIGDFAFRLKLAKHDESMQQRCNYLQAVMRYAGTISLEAESHPIHVSEAHAGDILCKGSAPGHAVVIVDEAVNEAGERCFLLAQGFMPSQSAHILAGYAPGDSPWYTEEQLGAEIIRLSSYTFERSALRRWKEGFV